jgi:AcrR family transcriptional regulator
MPRGARKPSIESETTDDPRDRILAAAERCITRYGLRKTTMEDIASEVGLSRPSVYRYFSDRDELVIELILLRARALRARSHKLIARQSNLGDQIVEGLLYVAEQARLDPVMRYISDPEGGGLGQRIITSRVSETLAAEFWDPFLDPAYVSNKLSRDIPRPDVYLWLSSLGLMLMRGLDESNDANRYRAILRHFVAPAFAAQGD